MDEDKTKEQLLEELKELRGRIAEMEVEKAKNKLAEETLLAVADPMNILDREFRIVWANQARAKMHNRTVEEMKGQHCYRMFQRRNEVCDECPVAETFRTGIPCTRERSADLPDGRRVWAESHAWPILEDGKEVALVVQYARDITQRKQAEEELRRSRDFLTSIANSIEDGLLVIEKDYKISYANDAICRQSGLTLDEIIGQPCHRIFHKREEKCQAPEHECHLNTVVETGLPKVLTHTHFDNSGSPVWVEVRCSPLFDEKGNVARVIEVFSDITKRKEAEEALVESEEKFRSISASAQDAIILMDSGGSVSYWNEAAERIFQYAREEAVGKQLHELIIPERFRENHLNSLSRFGQTGKGSAIGERLELVALKKDGEEFPIELSLSAVQIKEKWNSIGIVRDITQRKQVEEKLKRANEELRQHVEYTKRTQNQLIQSEKMASLGVMAGGIAHEIRNPLAVVSSCSQLLLTIYDDPDLIRSCAEKIHANIRRASSIIENLLKFARPPEHEIEEVDVHFVLDESITLMQSQFVTKSIRLERDFHASDLRILGSKSLFQHVFLNLILNACNAISKGGQLKISTVMGSKDRVGVIFRDTGCGIPESNLSKIFDPFFTTMPKGKGTGLGLSISYSIVKQLGGTIEVASKVDEGTTFTVWLPLRGSKFGKEPE